MIARVTRCSHALFEIDVIDGSTEPAISGGAGRRHGGGTGPWVTPVRQSKRRRRRRPRVAKVR